MITSLKNFLEKGTKGECRDSSVLSMKCFKIAALITAVALALILAAYPSIPLLLAFAPALYLCYEITTIAGNIQEIFETTDQDEYSGWTCPEWSQKVTRLAPLSRGILQGLQKL